jgi:hypothetical protein
MRRRSPQSVTCARADRSSAPSSPAIPWRSVSSTARCWGELAVVLMMSREQWSKILVRPGYCRYWLKRVAESLSLLTHSWFLVIACICFRRHSVNCGAQHLQRYVTELDFRYNHRKSTNYDRAQSALMGIAGKRLTYRRID